MKRIAYAPKVNVFVQADSGIFDLSPYVTSGSVSRNLDAVSTATIGFRNPNMKFTKEAIFHPMDPIVITMSRLPDKPVQVFTGYIDTAPYAALKPGVVYIQASCTLKRLLYTYVDTGLPFFHKFLHDRGWQQSGLGVEVSEGAGDTVDQQQADGENASDQLNQGLNDASFGQTLYDTLLYIGNWDPSAVYIENLPNNIVDIVEGIFYEIKEEGKEQRGATRRLLKRILEDSSITGGLGGGGGGGGGTPSNWNGQMVTGKVSYFGSGSDEQDTASGIYSTNPGCALNLRPGSGESGWNNETTQAWIAKAAAGNPVYAKITIQGKTANLPIIDLGPHEDTGRAIDVTGAGAEKMGFTATDSGFPTDAIGTAELI
jgi:hypothetical protein